MPDFPPLLITALVVGLVILLGVVLLKLLVRTVLALAVLWGIWFLVGRIHPEALVGLREWALATFLTLRTTLQLWVGSR
jgi:hypothetical protein